LKTANAKDPNIRKLNSDGLKLVKYVARFPGKFQDEAKKMISLFGPGTGEEAGPTARQEAKTFADARRLGKEAIDEMQASNLLVKELPERLKTLKTPEEKTEMQKQIEDATKAATSAKDDAVHYLKLAMGFANSETDIVDVNLVRYLLCYLSYVDKNYFEATVMV